ncbi:cell wall-binding repeat-containing protein [Pseudoclavibacter helvolus]|uniref:cell wall-binding repeat-containing protein n=1 Tax=Pseudoclavibacter helvolus TaxID=255205 RepID=UPI003C75F46E
MKKPLSLLVAVLLSASALTFLGTAPAQAASFGVVNQDVMSPTNYVAKGSYATTTPQGAPVSALSAQTAAMVDTLPDRYLNDFWKGRLKTSTNRENFTIPIYTVDSSRADANWVTVKMQSYALYPDIHPVMEGKATASATGGTYGFQITPFATTAKNYGKVAIPAHAVPGGPIPGGDKSMTVVDIATGIVRGYYVADKQADGSWLMGGGYLTTLNSPKSTNWFDQNAWLKTERGTSSVGGVMNEFLMAGAEEIAAGSINHITSWTFPSTRSGTAMWPAYQTDGKLSEAHAPKMGQRFWIPNDAATNAKIAALGLSSFEKVVVKNLQEYGGIVTDQNYWTMALNLQHPVTFTAQGKPNPYLPGGIVHNKHGSVDLINKIPWTLTKWGEITSSTKLPQFGAPTATAAPTPSATPSPTPSPSPTTSPGTQPGVAERIGSTDTYANAVTASTKFNTVGSKLVIASGQGGVDALLAAPVAAEIGGSMLLTKPDALPSNVSAEVSRLKPSAIFVIGQISEAQKTALGKLTPRLEVVGSADRAETSVLVAKRFFPNDPLAYVANSANQTDVANAASRAALAKAPLLLTGQTQTSSTFKAFIASGKVTSVRVVGTEASLSAGVLSEVKAKVANTTRINASEAFALNAALLKDFDAGSIRPKGFTIANSTSAEDTFVALLVTARTGYPLVLAKQACIPSAAAAVTAKYPSANYSIIGTTTDLVSAIHTKRCA